MISRKATLVVFAFLILQTFADHLYPPYRGAHGVHEKLFEPSSRANSGMTHVFYHMHDSGLPTADVNHTVIDATIHGQHIKGHFFRLSNPAQHFAILPPLGGCPGRVLTSVTAQHFKCAVGMNAGFFNMRTGACLGNLVSAGRLIQTSTSVNANFGTLSDGRYLIGYVPADEVASYDFTNLVAGVLWLVRNSSSWVDGSAALERPTYEFINMKAPRTGIAHDHAGNLLLFEVDGDEPTGRGLSLYEFADLMIEWGAVNAVNLDGGGSATVYMHGSVINQPSDKCPSGVGRCERTVTSICCIA